MKDILTEISEYAAFRVAENKKKTPLAEIKRLALNLPRGDFAFENAIRRAKKAMICEVKRASPSKGMICPDFHPTAIAEDYERSGADCLSVLTEPKWFLGSDKILSDIRKKVKIPIIRKDFTVDEYQLYEAKLLGADCVLLIVSILGEKIEKYQDICSVLGISALVETHDEKQIDLAAKCGARLIGVNNRNLKDFSVDFSNSKNLALKIPAEALFVAESGVKTPADVAELFKIGADAVLCGEALMRSDDRGKFIREAKNG